MKALITHDKRWENLKKLIDNQNKKMKEPKDIPTWVVTAILLVAAIGAADIIIGIATLVKYLINHL